VAEWVIERGIGETRAALIDNDLIIEARIEIDDNAPRAGDVVQGVLLDQIIKGRRGLVRLESGHEALLEPCPAEAQQGRTQHFLVIRAAVAERDRVKRVKVRLTSAALGRGPSLIDQIEAGVVPFRTVGAHDPDVLETAGWSECLEEAEAGTAQFKGGTLLITPTPAMILIDVDGWLGPAELGLEAARAAAAAIRRYDLSGSIGVDFPTLAGKHDRQSIAQAFDAVLPQPFERTAINGFGFMQIIRKRERASLIEILRDDPVGASTRALLRLAQRAKIAGALCLVATPAIAARLTAAPDWTEHLARDIGGRVTIRSDPTLVQVASYVEAA
jgi:Ribonuclease E/G family